MIHTHAHTSYSRPDGVGSPSHHARIAASLGHVALAQTEHGNLNGALAHRKACNEVGIIPICGMEAYWRPDHRLRIKEERYARKHLVLLAKNLRGWHNLIRLSSAAYNEGFYQNPCISWELQERHAEGMICSSGCVLSPLPQLILTATDTEVDEWIERSLRIYGDDLFFAIQPQDMDVQREVNLAIVSKANKFGIPLIHESDVHYPERDWPTTQKIAVLVGMNKTFADAEEANRKRLEAGEDIYELWHDGLHLMGEDEVRDRYRLYHPNLPPEVVDEAIRNTDELAARVDPYLMDRSLKMPRSAKGVDPKTQVMQWCREGLRDMGREGDPVYEDRLAYEARVIDQNGTWPYFHLVADVVRWARSDEPLPPTHEDPDPERKRPIRINSGRGSAAASLVCRTARITMIDPIAHRFKFERFMNPERKSMPDIDIDIASSGRQLLKEYVARKHGRDAVADLVAQQHYQPRAALQLVTKTIYGYKSDAFDTIAKLTAEDTGVIDPVHDSDLAKLREREPSLDEWATRWPEAWEHARRLENAGDPSVLRLSKHAGAVAIVPGKVTDYLPTIKSDEDDIGVRTAWAETARISVADEIGIVKVDFLSLIGMDQQQMIVDAIFEHTGEMVDLDALPVMNDPYAVDERVMDRVFRQANTLGVNQLGGDGIRDFLRRARPENLVDLAAINALYRPGPLGSGGHNRFAKRKNGIEIADIPEPLKPVLGDTHGSIAFQEQVMELFEVLLGYTAGQADDIRKIIAKLYRDKGGLAAEKLAERREEFIAGASKIVGEAKANELWAEVEPYSGYSFNRAHAGSYMIQAYQDGHLKEHYSLFAYAVMLTLRPKKTHEILREARNFGVRLLPPDINISGKGFTVDHEAGAIRYGLAGIKGVGDAAVDQILEDRPYPNLPVFESRSGRKYSKVNKGVREALLKVGALDCFGAREDGNLAWRDEDERPIAWSARLRAQSEMDLLGVALEPGGLLGSDAPLVRENVYTEAEVAAAEEGERVVIGGRIADIRHTVVKRGRQAGSTMAFLKIALDLDTWSVTCFPDAWAVNENLATSGQMVMIVGRKDDRGSVICNQMMPLDEFIRQSRVEAGEFVAA